MRCVRVPKYEQSGFGRETRALQWAPKRESNHMRTFKLSILVMLMLGPAMNARAASKIDIGKLHLAVRTLVLRYYPEASTHYLGTRIHFEDDTKLYLRASTDSSGRRSVTEVRGPKAGGVYCDMIVRDGRVPSNFASQVLDRSVYTERISSSESRRYDCYLAIRLKTPNDVSERFLIEFGTLVRNFEEANDIPDSILPVADGDGDDDSILTGPIRRLGGFLGFGRSNSRTFYR